MNDEDVMLSRRRFLTTTLGASCAMLLASAACRSPLPAASVAAGGGSAVSNALPLGIDMHNHVYPAGTEPHPSHGGPPGPPHDGAGPPASPPPDVEASEHPAGPQLTIADEVTASGLTAVCASFVLDFAPMARPGDARANLLHWLDAIDAQLAAGHVHRALTLADLVAAHATGRPTIVQSVEGSMFIEGELSRIEEVYARGLRHLQLLHEHDDLVSPLGDVNSAPAHLGGLTPMGQAVIKECNRLGILVDLAHASHETVLAALRITAQPVIVSHTSLDTFASGSRMAAMMKPRLLSREHAKVIADAGGVIGVWTHMADSLPAFVESIKAMVDATGVDHVGIGSDTDLLSTRTGHGTDRVWASLTGGFFPAVVGEMQHQGFSAEEIAKIGGGNFCRVFGAVTTGRG